MNFGFQGSQNWMGSEEAAVLCKTEGEVKNIKKHLQSVVFTLVCQSASETGFNSVFQLSDAVGHQEPLDLEMLLTYQQTQRIN